MKHTLLAGLALAALAGSPAIAQSNAQGTSNPPTSPSGSVGVNAATNTSTVTEDQVRANLLSTGFTRVDGLMKASDGNWHAVGTKGDTQMPVVVDPYGRILSR
jgi:hypothetical protein